MLVSVLNSCVNTPGPWDEPVCGMLSVLDACVDAPGPWDKPVRVCKYLVLGTSRYTEYSQQRVLQTGVK